MAPHADFRTEAITDTEAITLPDPLTLINVEARRTKAGKLIAGTAATSDFTLFKGGLEQHSHKAKAKDWESM